MRKFFVFAIVTALMCALAACGETVQPTNSDTTNNPIESQSQVPDSNTEIPPNDGVSLTQEMTFLGLKIYYPNDAQRDKSDHGSLIGTEDYCIIVESTTRNGKQINVDAIDDVPEICEKYIKETMEHEIRTLFDHGKTELTITSSQKIDSDIQALLVKGTATNGNTGEIYNYAAIYLLAGPNGNIPVYIVGVPMTDGYDVDALIEKMASKIAK